MLPDVQCNPINSLATERLASVLLTLAMVKARPAATSTRATSSFPGAVYAGDPPGFPLGLPGSAAAS